jgi:endonuclease-8
VPEGDTIARLARRLARALVGKEVRRASLPALVGRSVAAVDARGKNLLVRFDDGRVLHVHLRMVGRVRVAREAPEPRLGRDARRGALHLAVDGAVVTGWRIPVLRLLSASEGRRALLSRASAAPAVRTSDLASLGPDVAAAAFDEAEALRRLRALGPQPVADALVVQRAVAGIGNVYKSEVLFLERVDPRTRVRELDDARLLGLVRRARALLLANLRGRGPRRTRASLTGAGPRLWVYGRAGERCLACGAAIARLSQGLPGAPRSTYHCPSCQR